MSKHIIIDWQRDSVLLAAGTRRAGGIEIENFGIATAPAEGAEGPSLFAQLRDLTQKFDLAKSTATVIAPRESLEFRILTIPRGDADEIPDMVRFQATRQMANIGDSWPLDYILLPDSPGQEGLAALATTISPAHLAEIESTCSDLGLTVTKILPRPVEIARLGVLSGDLASHEAALVIALSEHQADILITSRGSLVQLRGTRLPEDPAAQASTLVAEIRRSLMAAASFLNGNTITRTVLIAAPDLAGRVETQIASATNADVKVIDPATLLPASQMDRHDIAHRAANRLAAIGGVLTNAAPNPVTVIDLKNVKKRIARQRNYRPYILGGVVAAVVLLGLGSWWWSVNADLDNQISDSQKTLASLKELNTTWKKVSSETADVNKFLAGSVNWLQELETLATRLPPAEEIVLTNPNLELMQDNATAQITVPVWAKTRSTLTKLEDGLRDKTHTLRGNNVKDAGEGLDYRWTSNYVIRISDVGWDPLAKPKTVTASKPTEPTSGKTATENAAPSPAAADVKSDSAPKPLPVERQGSDAKPSEGEKTAPAKTGEQPNSSSPSTERKASSEAT